MIVLLLLATFFLAYSNGANDNFKGVATLFGSNTTNYKKAISWATMTTFAGSLAAIFLTSELIKNFSGKGLVPEDLLLLPTFAISVALGAAITVFLATKIGMPISTTHGLVGALLGAGIIAVGKDFNFSKLALNFFVPLLIVPVIAGAFSFIAYHAFKYMRQKSGISKSNCLCVNESNTSINVVNCDESVAMTNAALTIIACDKEIESEQYDGELFGITIQNLVDSLHFFSAGIVSFARGLNDTPKIVGLLLVVNAFEVKFGILAIGVAIAIGGLINAKKVGITMSKKITPMTSSQGFTANLVTGLLVTIASVHGLPVSTTHVSVGSIFGIGSVTKKTNGSVVSKIILSWVLTLPIAAIFGALVYIILANNI